MMPLLFTPCLLKDTLVMFASTLLMLLFCLCRYAMLPPYVTLRFAYIDDDRHAIAAFFSALFDADAAYSFARLMLLFASFSAVCRLDTTSVIFAFATLFCLMPHYAADCRHVDFAVTPPLRHSISPPRLI